MASKEKMTQIFDLLCDDFIALLKDKKLQTSDRKLLMDFLKDNGVDADLSQNPEIKKHVLNNLPFSEDDERDSMALQ